MTLPVLDVAGKKVGSVSLPEEAFGIKLYEPLLAQAVRIYLANQRQGHAATKTRGEVEGSTRKIYRQKGTGRARHGGIRAPIFVGGGITFGPQPRSYSLDFPKKMRRHALGMALSKQYADGNVAVVAGTGDLEPKTKAVVSMMQALGAQGSTLLVVPKDAKKLVLGARNIARVDISPVEELHTYTVLTHDKIIFTKETLPLVAALFKNP